MHYIFEGLCCVCMTSKSEVFSVRIDPKTKAELTAVASKAGYKSLGAFMVAASREKARLIRDEDVLTAMEERIGATFAQVMQGLSTINDGVQVNVTQVSKLAQAFFTCVPAPPPEAMDASIAQARARFKRWEQIIAAEREAGNRGSPITGRRPS